MKLLFDENISHRLTAMLSSDFPDSRHIRNCGLLGEADEKIWDFAKDGGFLLVSKDSDFYQRAILRGAPPKVVWLRIGNCTTQLICSLLSSHREDIEAFENSSENILTIR